MRDVLLWWILLYGLVNIVTQSKLFAPIRKRVLPNLLNCPMCFAVWAGITLSIPPISLGPALSFVGWPFVARALANGIMASAVCWTTHVVMVRLGANEL